MWVLPGRRLEPVSPALAGGFLTTAPPGKSGNLILNGVGKPWSPGELSCSTVLFFFVSTILEACITSMKKEDWTVTFLLVQVRNFISCFKKKKKKGRSLPIPQQRSIHYLQPMKNSHNLELSNELFFRTTLPNFLLKPNKSQPHSFVLWACLWFPTACLFQIAILCYSQINLFCW